MIKIIREMKNQRKFTVVIERDEEGYYVGTVPTLPVAIPRRKLSTPVHSGEIIGPGL